MSNRFLPTVLVAAFFALAGCQSDPAATGGPDAAGDSPPILRVHDVSRLDAENLDHNLNDLLSRQDLPLRGQVRLLDEGRLAVNAPPYVQEQIAGILTELQVDTAPEPLAESAAYRVRFWIVRMVAGSDSEHVPVPLARILDELRPDFPGFGSSVQDYMETYHYSEERGLTHITGAGSQISFRQARPLAQGIHLHLSIRAVPSNDGLRQSMYQVNRELLDGQPLVLGKVFGGLDDGLPSYQLVIAQADRLDDQSTDMRD
jgi:hypothetical protein